MYVAKEIDENDKVNYVVYDDNGEVLESFENEQDANDYKERKERERDAPRL